MAEQKESKDLIYELELRSRLLDGAAAAYDAVAVTYGPKGRNVLLERGFGRPTFTRDGATIVKQVFFADRVKNMGAGILAEASETANIVSGDGSSATVVFGYHLLHNAVQAVAAGQHPMDVSAQLEVDSTVLLADLKKLAATVEDKQLKEVATVSSGDPLIGQLLAEAVLYVGQDGGILTEKSLIPTIEREYVDGYYLQSGFTALTGGKKELVNPYVIVSSKRLSSTADITDLLNALHDIKKIAAGQTARVLFVGNFEDAAYTTIVNTINAQQIDAVVIKTPPMYGEYGKYLLDDIALYADCLPLTENSSFDERFIGKVDKVVASKSEATIFADNDTEDVVQRIAEIKAQLEAETVPAVTEKLRDRIAKLEGKIALFKIGGVNDSVREELGYRVEDAINATRHAHREGVVPGGGVTWLTLSNSKVSDMTRNALRATFQQLLINANLPPELKLYEALAAKPGMGYDLRKGDKLINVAKAGILDPVVVAREVIRNATGAAANAIKTGMALTFVDTDK